ncbi:MAG: hypothetical protein WBD16_06470 [Pyrinomonadaceae bacterium]
MITRISQNRRRDTGFLYGTETEAIQDFAGAGAQASRDASIGIRNGIVNTFAGTVNALNPVGVAVGLELPTLQAENAKQAAYETATKVGIFAGTIFGAAAVAPASSVSVVPQTATRAPSFLGQANGPAIAVPNGSSQTAVVNSQGNVTGLAFTGGRGGNGLSDAVTSVRVMNPTTRYPNGYVTYMNINRQGVNPFSGRTIPNADPLRHVPLNR